MGNLCVDQLRAQLSRSERISRSGKRQRQISRQPFRISLFSVNTREHFFNLHFEEINEQDPDATRLVVGMSSQGVAMVWIIR